MPGLQTFITKNKLWQLLVRDSIYRPDALPVTTNRDSERTINKFGNYYF